MKCPKCGGRKLVPILYGMPAFSEEMKRKLENRESIITTIRRKSRKTAAGQERGRFG